MKRNLLFGIMVLLTGSLFAADSTPKDDVSAAAKKLADTSDYSWKTTTEFGQFESSTDGKTQTNGPMTSLSMNFNDNVTEVAMKGGKTAVKTPDGDWQTLAEMESDNDQQGPGRFLARIIQNYKAPATEVKDIISKTKEIKKDADVYSSDLTDEGAKALLSFGGRRGGEGPSVSNAKGSVKLWIKDGTLSKYELHLRGTMNFNGEDRDIDRTSTTEIKDVGSTKVEFPDAAAKKLS